MKAKKKPKAPDPYRIANPVPSTWTISNWPTDVYPFTSSRAKRACLEHRDDLVKHLALTRVGKELVIMGSAYMRWLSSMGNQVFDYGIAPNAPEHAPKRGGKGKAKIEEVEA